MPVQYEPQLVHWPHEQVIVHSSLLNHNGQKSYHPYLSHEPKHNQAFVECVLREMLNIVKTKPGTNAIIESDNSTQQYKPCAKFESIQCIASDYGFKILGVFWIPEHGKEVDHVGGIARTTIWREIAAGEFYSDAGEMVEILRQKFGGTTTAKTQ